MATSSTLKHGGLKMIGGLNLHTIVDSMRMMMVGGTMTLELQAMMERMMRRSVRPSKLNEWPRSP